MTGRSRKGDYEAIYGSPLKIEYDRALDLLTLRSEKPASNGDPVADGLAVFCDEADQPHTVTLENAAELLLPLLTQGRTSK